MVLNIALSNILSFKNEASLDFQVVRHRLPSRFRLDGNFFTEGGSRLLKSIAIFGANASGKSNFVNAIQACVKMILESQNYTASSETPIEPYKFSSNVLPSEFDIDFLIGSQKFNYGFSVTGDGIVVEEHLYAFPKAYRSLVFLRNKVEDDKYSYKFSKLIPRPKEITANTSPFQLLLSRSAQMNREIPLKVWRFFCDNIMFGLPDMYSAGSTEILKQHKPLILEALQHADSDIVDYELQTVIDNRQKMFTFHKHNASIPFDFDNEESAGTRRLLSVLIGLISTIEQGKLLIVDELEKSLHSHLMRYIVTLFNQSQRAQILFTTHDLNILDATLLRPDQIYFVAKNASVGASELYSLTDFSDYKDFSHIQRDYQLGRFDAVPYIDDSHFVTVPQ